MGPIGGPETSVNNYKSSLPDVLEERRSHLHSGERLKSKIFVTTPPLSDDTVDNNEPEASSVRSFTQKRLWRWKEWTRRCV